MVWACVRQGISKQIRNIKEFELRQHKKRARKIEDRSRKGYEESRLTN